MKHDVKPCYDILKPCYDIPKPYYEILIMLTFEDYKSYISTLWISVSMGFRSPLSGRMAVWLWFRCVFGPQLQRIHRSQEQPLTEGRTGRRVWLFTILYLLPNTAVRENLTVLYLLVLMWLRTDSGAVRCLIHIQLQTSRLALNEWLKGRCNSHTCVFQSQHNSVSPPTAALTAALHVFLNSATLNWPC